MKSWTIVEFLQDGTVEAVPTSWLIEDYCHWPSFPHVRLMKAMKACETVNKCWPTHAVKHFKNGTFDNYATARAKAKVAEETSDLQSEVEQSELRKRKILEIVSDTDEESESVLPPPPALKRRNELGTCSRTVDHTESDEVLPPPSAINRRYELSTCSRTVDQVESAQVATNSTIIGDGQTQQLLKTLIEQQKTLIEQQHLLRCLLTDVFTRVENMEKMMQGNQTSSSSSSVQQSTSIFEKIDCPVNSQEEFNTLNAFLRDGENARNVACELANIGGTNCASFVKRTLGTLITNKLAMEFSWLGKKGKKRFEATKLASVIIDAAKISNIACTSSDTEMCIQKWLKRAAERCKVVAQVF